MYIIIAVPSCFRFDRHILERAFSRARAKTGKRIAARMAMMAITTSNSIRVKPERRAVPRRPLGSSALLARMDFPPREESKDDNVGPPYSSLRSRRLLHGRCGARRCFPDTATAAD